MDNFTIIYQILKTLEKAMKLEEFDKNDISAESLKIPVPLWSRIIKMMFDSGYITGVDIWQSYDCGYPKVSLIRPEITLKGLEYLNDNSIMKKIANTLKGVKEVIPGL
ncbi:MAG: YjcQ family protein [Acutalibacteraceae bacterium]|nr:YjcQ family protein [Acutalibacteraceae bacterium]